MENRCTDYRVCNIINALIAHNSPISAAQLTIMYLRLTLLPRHTRYTQQQQPRTAAQRHHLTQNLDLIRTGDQLVQQEIDEYRHKQLTSSTHSSHSDGSSSVSVEQRAPLSPTTHILLLPEEDSSDQNQIETFV